MVRGFITFAVALFTLIGSTLPCAAQQVPQPKLDGVLLWFKADAIQGAADASVIQNWPDSGGKGGSAAIAPGKLSPIYVKRSIGEQPAVRFFSDEKGGGVSLLTSSIDLPKTHSFVVVARESDFASAPATDSHDNAVFLWFESEQVTPKDQGPVLGLGNAGILRSEGKRLLRVRNYAKTETIVDSERQIDASKPHVYTLVAGPEFTQAYVDGKTVALGTEFGGAVPNKFAGAAGVFRIGQHGSSNGDIGQFLCADVAEIIVLGQPLSDADRTALDAYLKAKYQIGKP